MRNSEPVKDPVTPGCPVETAAANRCQMKPVKEEWSASKRKFWLSIIVTAFLMFNISAVVTAIAVVGMRTGKLPESTVVNSLIHLALDVLKTVFAA